VLTHILANPTAKYAGVVLPAAGFTEKRGSMVNLSGRLQRLNRATRPPGHARDDWEILRDLLAHLGADTSDLGSLQALSAALAPALNDHTLATIGDAGVPILDTGYLIPLLEHERAS
jgi:NADH-quinone oxidoreductase subunit G